MWALLYIEQDPNYTSVNINIVCMVVVTLLMVHSSTLGHISAVFIAHVTDQGKLYQLCILLLAVWATKCAQRCAGVHCYTQKYKGALQLHTIMIFMLPAVSI